MTYYNEHDPAAAAWLRELIAAGEIPAGVVDERSIWDVSAADLAGYAHCHFFAGIGGWALALQYAGWPDDRAVWTGSCPCQSFSAAGRGSGLADERHLWPVWFDLIERCRPAAVVGEQVESAIGHGWLDLVCDDLEGIGYAVAAVGLPAACVGAPHIRQRIWFVADQYATGCDRQWGGPSADGDTSSWDDINRGGAARDLAAQSGRGFRVDGGARRDTGHTDIGGTVGDVADQLRGGFRDSDGAEGQSGNAPGGEPVGALGDTGRAGSQGRESRELPGSRGPDERRATSEPSGTWGTDLEWVRCRDGAIRPTQSGLFPLVARVSGHVVPSGDPGESYANATAEARVMRLRGYGNAIVPQVAAAVLGAYLEIRGGDR